MRALAPLLALVSASCLRSTTFHCTTSNDCTKSGVTGECQTDVGFCSFADTTCTSGQRYGELSGGLSGQCVGAPPDAPVGYFKVGGTVSGLAGTGLVLRDNGGDDLAVAASGPFTFATALMMGQSYAVTVGTQPSAGTCSVGNGSGTIASADVTNVAVTCTSGGDPGIFCGGTTSCTVGSQVCCNADLAAPTCSTSGACTGTKMTCDDAADCGGGSPICCSKVNAGGNWQGAQCQSSCNPPNVVMCDPAAPTPCSGGLTCKPYAKLPSGYHACQ